MPQESALSLPIGKEHRGFLVSWDAIPGFKGCWHSTYPDVEPPDRPIGRIVTRDDKQFQNMVPEVGVFMGNHWVFPAETLNKAENVTFRCLKLGVFGGSFDPIHNGHSNSAKAAMEKHGLDRIIFIPARISPHKLDTNPALFTDRVNMVEIVNDSEPKFACDPREGEREGPSFTIDTLTEIQAECPNAEFHLLIGADQLAAFEHWHRPDDIRKIARIIVMPRPTDGHSSTEIRNRIKTGKPFEELVDPQVANYIQTHQIYS